MAEDGSVYQQTSSKRSFINGVGAGDSMVAGFLAGWMKEHSYEEAFYMGLSAGSASAFSEFLATEKK